ncbi:MAG: hypothetical protein NVV59_15930 [Chitinophagaceae bacterium]|nr:hypothetical protein [Chitinophagaceae bacterium]
MKKLFSILAIVSLVFSSCIKVNLDDSVTNVGGGNGGEYASQEERIIDTRVISGQITEHVTLPKGKYTLKGYVYVTNRAILTFAPGSVIVSDITNKGALIIERNSKLIAAGTASEPIVFTSGKAPGQRQPGDWGGIILLGNAPTNRATEPTIEGGVNAQYGGAIAGDNSGILTYVRIEFAGIASDPGSEINGLTLGGVGSGTKLENIQVSFGNDDAFEFFGGTVNAKNLIAFATADDDFDFDFGYTGQIQFGLSLRKTDFFDPGDDTHGVECDNDGSGSAAAPFTRPVLSNFTFIGQNAPHTASGRNSRGNRWRRNARFVLRNSILMATQNAGVLIESAGTAQAYLDGISAFKNNLVHAINNPYAVAGGAETVLTAAEFRAKAENEGCITFTSLGDIKLNNPLYSTAPNFLPADGSPALTGADFSGLPNFFTPVTYRGAFGIDNWTAGWTNFDPQHTQY